MKAIMKPVTMKQASTERPAAGPCLLQLAIAPEHQTDPRRRWKQAMARLSAFALGAGLLLQTGCALLLVGGGAAAGIGGYAYVKGELKTTENAPLDRVCTATVTALEELKYPLTSQQRDTLMAQFVARNSQDKKVSIQLKSLSGESTEIKVRVGTFGDEALSMVIVDKIKSRL